MQNLLFTVLLCLGCASSTISIDIPLFSYAKKKWQNARCRYSGGCQPECGGFKPNVLGLNLDLNLQLFGQHIANQTVFQALSSHWSRDDPSKALVMSFHGLTGVGKTHLANLIVKNMYGFGLMSPFVHKFHSGVEFNDPKKLSVYKAQLQKWIQTNVTRCERSIFIFDDVEEMPEGIVDSLKPFLEPQPLVRINNIALDFRKSIFIFISNIGGMEIAKHCFSTANKGKERESIKLSDLQSVLRGSIKEQKSGLRNSVIETKHLIDHYVPFLPLTEKHVRQCISNELNQTRPDQTHSEEVFDLILNELEWYSGVSNEAVEGINRYAPAEIAQTLSKRSDLIYSTSGCTIVASKVALHLH